MAKRMPEQSEENRIVAKSRPTAMNLTSVAASSSVNSPIASSSLGVLKASSRQVGLSGRPDPSAYIKIPIPTQRRVLKDGKVMLNCSSALVKLVATGKDQKVLNRREKFVISTGELVATEYLGCSGNPQTPEERIRRFRTQQSNLVTSFPYITRLSTSHGESLFDLRKIYDRKPTDNLRDFDVNTAIWCIFMSVTLQAAVHLGRDYSLNLRSIKNQSSNSVDQFSRTTEKLIKEHMEIRIVHD